MYFWLRWVFVAVHGLSLVAASGSYLLWCVGFSLWWLLLLRSMGSRCTGFSSCGTRAQQLWCMGLVALQHVGSSWTRARTCVPCIGRQIPRHQGSPSNAFLNSTSGALSCLSLIDLKHTCSFINLRLEVKNSSSSETCFEYVAQS